MGEEELRQPHQRGHAWAEKVDLSSFNIVTTYDKPAIEKFDDTLRIEFCAS